MRGSRHNFILMTIVISHVSGKKTTNPRASHALRQLNSGLRAASPTNEHAPGFNYLTKTLRFLLFSLLSSNDIELV